MVSRLSRLSSIYISELLLCSMGQQLVLKPVEDEHTLLTSTLGLSEPSRQNKHLLSIHSQSLPLDSPKAWSSRCSFSLAFVVCSIKHSNAQVLMVVHFVDDICYVGPLCADGTCMHGSHPVQWMCIKVGTADGLWVGHWVGQHL